MGTIDKLNYLNETKGLIKEAIKRKGVTVEDTDTFRSYADKIDNIDAGANLNDYFTDTLEANANYNQVGIAKSIKRIKTPANVIGTSLSRAFFDCINLIEVDLSNLDSSNITDLSNMFNLCQSLKNIIFGNFNTANVINMEGMFWGCSLLENCDISKFNTSNVTILHNFMYQVRNLKEINMSSWDMGKIVDLRDAFYQGQTSLLTDLLFGYDLGKGYLTSVSANYNNYTLDLHSHSNLSHDSLMSVINGLYDIATAGVQTQKLVLGGTNLAKLSSEEIAIATNKGWTVS